MRVHTGKMRRRGRASGNSYGPAPVIARLKAIRVPAGPIQRPAEALAHEQTRATDMVVTVQHDTVGDYETVATPYRLSGTPVVDYEQPPLLGADTSAVLEEVLGLDEAALGALRAEGAIA